MSVPEGKGYFKPPKCCGRVPNQRSRNDAYMLSSGKKVVASVKNTVRSLTTHSCAETFLQNRFTEKKLCFISIGNQ